MFIAIHNFMNWMNKPKGHKMDLNVKSTDKVTFFVIGFLSLVSFLFSVSLSAKTVDPIKKQMKESKYYIPAPKNIEPDYKFSGSFEISRSTALYNFRDGSHADGLDLQFVPVLMTPIGSFSLKETYSRNLHNDNDVNAGFSDAAVTYGFGSMDWDWSTPYVLTLSPSATVIIPISEISVKKNQLQTAIAGGLSLGIRPDNVGENQSAGWTFSIAATAGRSFHAFEEDINGAVLNKYSSNQSVSLGYKISDFNFVFNYTNRSRWTYQNKIKQSFVMSQEIAYSINENFNVSVGHTNDVASILKANGFESNLQIIDENNSGVYLSLGAGF